MNTLTGKSVGIALLMAAALIAALFAMGVFAPAGVDAGVKSTPKPTAELSSNKPADTGVTLTATFETNDDVDGTAGGGTDDDVIITLAGFTYATDPAFDGSNVTVTQNGTAVGSVAVDTDTITIGQPEAGGNVLRANVETDLVITGLTNPAAGATAASIAFHQEPNNTVPTVAPGLIRFAIHPSVTEASVELINTDTADDAKGDYETGATPVTMMLTFQVDTASTGSSTPAGSDVVITLPSSYDLDTDETTNSGAVIDDGKGVTVSNGSTVTVADDGASVTVHTFAVDTDVTVTITGLTNSASSMMETIGFKQGDIPTAVAADPPVMADPKYHQTAMFYITDPEAVAVSTMLDPGYAGATDATLSIEFGSVVDLSMMSDSSIMIELASGFSGLSERNVSVMQQLERDGSPMDVGGNVMVDGNTITIMHDDTEDANNVMKTMSRSVGNVMVEITGLTNPSNDGELMNAVTVSQDGYMSSSASQTIMAAPVEPKATLSSYSAGAAVKLTINARAAEEIRGGHDIDVTLPGFGIPSDGIDREKVFIYGTGTNAFFGNPSGVTVNKSVVTLTLPVSKGTSDAGQPIEATVPMGDYQIIFNQDAGLTNPTTDGSKTIEVDNNDDGTADHELMVTITPSVSVKPSFVARGDDATVTAKGLDDGTATVHLNSRGGSVVGSGTAEDGVVEIVIDTSDLYRGATRDGDIDKGANTLYVKDASNEVVGSTTIGIKPKITLGSDSAKRFGKLEISLSDWYYGSTATVTIGGVSAGSETIGGANKKTFEVEVPGSVRTGVQEVKVSGSNPRGLKTSSVTADVTVNALAITISPDTVVPGSQITITGSGYVKNTDVMEIMIGDEEADLPEPDDREATSAGRIAYTITVPLGVGNGDKDVMVTVGTGDNERVGVGEITVPKPAIELDPATSVPGSVISVNGSGFASSGRVEVMYKDAIEEVGRADSSGDFHIRLEIPSDAGVGKTNEIKVTTRGTESINAKAEHKTPGSAITVPETAQVGTLATVSGTNFEPFSQLEVRIGGKDANPSPRPETDKNGAFEFEVRVPRLAAGSHTVTINDAEDNSVTETFSVVTTAVVSTPEEVFGVLGDALVSVWSLDNATKEWSAYFPGAPEGVSDLTGVSRGDIVWINVNADVEFQGGMLTTGWNLISLE